MKKEKTLSRRRVQRLVVIALSENNKEIESLRRQVYALQIAVIKLAILHREYADEILNAKMRD